MYEFLNEKNFDFEYRTQYPTNILIVNKEDFKEVGCCDFFDKKFISTQNTNDDDLFVQYMETVSWDQFKTHLFREKIVENAILASEKKVRIIGNAPRDDTGIFDESIYNLSNQRRKFANKCERYFSQQKKNPMILNVKNRLAIRLLEESHKKKKNR